MAKHEQQSFRNKTVVLDGNEFEKCNFESCVLEYQGLKPVTLNGSTMNNCQWSFKGPAANAVQFMNAMYQSGQQGAWLIEQTFNAIRGLAPLRPPASAQAAAQIAPQPQTTTKQVSAAQAQPARAVN